MTMSRSRRLLEKLGSSWTLSCSSPRVRLGRRWRCATTAICRSTETRVPRHTLLRSKISWIRSLGIFVSRRCRTQTPSAFHWVGRSSALSVGALLIRRTRGGRMASIQVVPEIACCPLTSRTNPLEKAPGDCRVLGALSLGHDRLRRHALARALGHVRLVPSQALDRMVGLSRESSAVREIRGRRRLLGALVLPPRHVRSPV